MNLYYYLHLFWFPSIFILLMCLFSSGISLVPYGWFSLCLKNPLLHSSYYGFPDRNTLCVLFFKKSIYYAFIYLPLFLKDRSASFLIGTDLLSAPWRMTSHCFIVSIVFSGILSFHSIVTHLKTMHSFSLTSFQFFFFLVTRFESIYHKVSTCNFSLKLS